MTCAVNKNGSVSICPKMSSQWIYVYAIVLKRGAPDRGLKVVRAFTNSCVCVGGGGSVEFDAEFKFAKIQNSHL